MDALDLKAIVALSPAQIAAVLSDESRPKGMIRIEIRNEIKPVDVYCYLYAKYGPPNGLQNFLRNDTSDNLVHWEWTFSAANCLLMISGLNFRTEVLLACDRNAISLTKSQVIEHIKSDIGSHGQKVGEVRKSLEKWKHIVNPFRRLQSSINSLKRDLDAIGIDVSDDQMDDFSTSTNTEAYSERWRERSSKYSKALGLAFGIRAMLPVLAESFVNFLIFSFSKIEIRSDKRIMEDIYKRPIDVRIRSLHLNCEGFAKAIDYSSKECAAYHSLVNERNDLLHGNITIDKLCFEDIYFNGRVPIFNEYRSMWERALRVEVDSVGLAHVDVEMIVVSNFIEYILSCMTEKGRKVAEYMISQRDIGFNPSNFHVGVLLPRAMIFPTFHGHPVMRKIPPTPEVSHEQEEVPKGQEYA